MIARTLLAVLAVALATLPAAAEKRVALVVGNAAYKEAPLRNPANDARAMGEALKRAGFEVIVRQNLTKPQMERAIAEFGDKLAGGGGDTVGLFFYAGHGMQLRGRNYLIPVDATLANEQRVRIETVDVDLVLEQMQAANARVSVAILDACRNNPFERRFRSTGGSGLAQMDAPEGTLIAYATAPGTVAADGEGANGLYTAELVRAMARPGLKIEDVFKQTRVGVGRASANAQVPWESSSLTGDFYFLAPRPGAPASAAAPAPPPRSELAAWEAVKNGRLRELEEFIDEFPDGPFAPLARVRIMELVASASGTPRAAQPFAPVEGRFWTTLPAAIVANDLGEIQLTVQVKNGRITGGGVTKRNQICRAVGQADSRGAILRLDVTCGDKNAAVFIGGRFPNLAATEPTARGGWMRTRTADDSDIMEVTWESAN